MLWRRMALDVVHACGVKPASGDAYRRQARSEILASGTLSDISGLQAIIVLAAMWGQRWARRVWRKLR